MERWALALRLTGIGWYIAVCVLVGVLGGLWLDRKLGTTPLFILLGTVFGMVAAFYGIYKLVAPLMGNDKTKGSGKG